MLCLTSQNNLDLRDQKFTKINNLPFRNGVEVNNLPNEVVKNSIMFLGRLEPIKRIDIVIQLAEIMPDYNFIVVGSGSLINELMDATDRLENIEYIGEVDNEGIPWRDVEWVILPSEGEGMSNVLLEAIANRKGIIASRIDQNKFVTALTNKLVWIDSNLFDVAQEVRSNQHKLVQPRKEFDKYKIPEVINDLEKILEKNT